jgi:hypothetical protein
MGGFLVGKGVNRFGQGPLAHDPPRLKDFGDKIMRTVNILARDRTQNRYPLLLIARLRIAAGHESRGG